MAVNSKNKRRAGWIALGFAAGLVFGAFFPSCGSCVTRSASDVAGNMVQAVK